MATIDPVQTAAHLLAGKYCQIAAFAMLIYDHCLTFGDEIERIWKRRFTLVSVLFVINRYATIVEVILTLEAFHNPSWSGKVCEKFFPFEGAGAITLVSIGQLIMILRVFAIYERSKRILALLMILWLSQIVVIGVGLRSGFPVPLPTGLPGCIESGGGLFPAVWIAPLVIDTTIFLLIIYRSKHYFNNYRDLTGQFSRPFRVGSSSRPNGHSQGAWRTLGLISKTIRVLVRDSILYFFFIFMVNLSNAIIYFSAPPDIKAIGGSFSQLITCTMVSRLVLNLRSLSESSSNQMTQSSYRGEPFRAAVPRNHQETSLWARTLDTLGGDDYDTTSTETKSTNPETMATSSEMACEIPMERIKDSHA